MWDERYAEPGFAYGSGPNDFIAAVADRIPDGPVLCLAGGEGRNAVFLAERGHDVTVVEQSGIGLAKAERLAMERGVQIRTITCNLRRYTVARQAWAGIVLVFAHLPPSLRKQVHAGVVEGLRPGGVLLLEAYTREQLTHGTGGPPVETLLFGLDDLRQELDGLVLEHAVEVVRDVVEGRYHTGPGAVVQVVARKPG